MKTLREEARDIPVVWEGDLCVVGGSCTGVFAAVAAARRGLSVALIENQNQFGGNTTAGFVAVWHSFWDLKGESQVIGGLSAELVEKLKGRGAITESTRTDPSWQYALNPAETALALDYLVGHPNIRPFLHARMVAVMPTNRQVTAIVIEDKSGRRAIRAKTFIDASGDGDLVFRAGGETYTHPGMQPPTLAALIGGLEGLKKEKNLNLAKLVHDPANPHGLPPGFLWSYLVPGTADQTLVFGTRVHGVDCASADDLTRAEMEGRAQVGQILAGIKHAFPNRGVTLSALPSRIGIRETRHAKCLHTLTEPELLHGVRFDDAIANGTYRVDIHHQGGDGLTFRYLDGTEVVISGSGDHTKGRWRPEQKENPGFYQIPYRSLVPVGFDNLLVAGRCLDADKGAFGAVRVQVNCNQTGEAAGVAASLAVKKGLGFPKIEARDLREELGNGGAVVVG